MKNLISLFVLGIFFNIFNPALSYAGPVLVADEGVGETDAPVANPAPKRDYYDELRQCVNLAWRNCLIDHHEDYRNCVDQNLERGVKLEDTLKFCSKWAMDKMDKCLIDTKNACIAKTGGDLLGGLLSGLTKE